MNWSEFIAKAIRVPFVECGRDYSGWDCWGLVYIGYRDVLGIEIPSYASDYTNTEAREELAALVNGNKWQWQSVPEPVRGDIILLTTAKRPVHVGIFIPPSNILHSLEGINTICEPLRLNWQGRRLDGFYRYAG